MKPRQSVGVALMLSLLVPLGACNSAPEGGEGEDTAPAVESPAPAEEGGEGNEGGEGGEGGEG